MSDREATSARRRAPPDRYHRVGGWVIIFGVTRALSPGWLAMLACACPSAAAPGSEAEPTRAASPEPAPSIAPGPTEHWERDILATALDVNLAEHTATATIELAAASRPGVSFEAGGLDVRAVRIDGAAARFSRQDGALHVDAPASATRLEIDYAFRAGAQLEGAHENARGSLTLTWPYHCGNLFPCHSSPADGIAFALAVQAPAGQRAIHPSSVDADAPSYMLAWAAGDYDEIALGTTAAGRRVSLWAAPEHVGPAREATTRLPELFGWLESTYGEYMFGDHVGSVVVDWGPDGLGGMEHHPFWHVAFDDADGIDTHVHEAAHGWYGNGVRIACWEDFVLSEGTASYMATRATAQVLGRAAADKKREHVRASFERLHSSGATAIAWPEGCNGVDILKDGLFGPAPYVKGELFYEAVAQRIGVEALDAVLREFYLAHRGGAAHMDDMLALIEQRSGWNPRACAKAWLRSTDRPGPDAC